jgi:hypothetical protein
MPASSKVQVFGNVRTVFSGANHEQKLRAVRDIGYCAIGAGLVVAGFASMISVDSWLINSSPIVATILGGTWAAIKA